jgi:hypothetical protein
MFEQNSHFECPDFTSKFIEKRIFFKVFTSTHSNFSSTKLRFDTRAKAIAAQGALEQANTLRKPLLPLRYKSKNQKSLSLNHTEA